MFANKKLVSNLDIVADRPLPSIGFSTNVLNHPSNQLIDTAHIDQCVDYLGDHFRWVEIELSEAAEKAAFEVSEPERKSLAERIKKIKQEKDIGLSLHATWFGKSTNLCAVDKEERLRSIEMLRKNIDFAGEIGANVVTCHPGYHQNQSAKSITDRLLESLKVVNDYAKRHEVTLCLENMGDDRPSYVVLDVEQQIEICTETDIKIAMDIIHLRSLYDDEDSFKTALRILAPFVGNAHIADMTGRRHNHLPIGDGDLDLTGALSILSEFNYNRAAIVEEWVRNRSFDDFFNAAVAYKNILDDKTRSVVD